MKHFAKLLEISVLLSVLFCEQTQASMVLDVPKFNNPAFYVDTERSRADRLFEAATLARQQEDYSLALRLYQQALQIYRGINDLQSIEYCLYNIGAIYSRTGDYQQALDYLQEMRIVARSLNNARGEWHALTLIGSIYGETGEYSRAIEFQTQALNIAQNLNLPLDEQAALTNLGLLYIRLGQYDLASSLFQRALGISQRIAEDDSVDQAERGYVEGMIFINIGLINSKLENYDQAIQSYQQALTIFQALNNDYDRAAALNSLGYVYNRIGQPEQALRFLEQGLSIARGFGDRVQIAYTLDSLGSTYASLEQFDRAWENYQQAFTLLTDIGDRSEQRSVLSNIGDLFVQQNQPELAIIFYKRSINITEAIRRDIQGLPVEQQQSYTNTVADTYRKLADLLLQQDRVLEAQQVLDLLKVQEIQDYLRRGVRGNEQTAAGIYLLPAEEQVFVQFDQLLQQGRRLAELDALPSETLTPEQQADQAELRTLQIQVKASFNGFLDLPDVQTALQDLRVRVPQALNLDALDAIRQNLVRSRPDAVLLYPFVLEDRLELVLMSPHLPPIHQTVPVTRVELNQAIVDFLTVLQDPQADPKPAAAKLYQWLGKPIEPFLQESGAKVILYAPDQRLRYIPLAALYDGQQWFVEKYQINQLTAANLTSLDTPPRSQPRILAGAFAAGRYMISRRNGEYQYPFNGLPFAKPEVEMIARLFPTTRPLIDQAFSRNATIPFLNSYNIVHFATHAQFTTGAPDDSFIVLGDGETIDLNDIRNLSLTNVDLMVLSGCQTAVSTLDLGQGLGDGVEILGFGYQVQNAGVRAAIASLWSVDDGGTEVLMRQLYTRLQGNLSKAAALQQAQIALIRGEVDLQADAALPNLTELEVSQLAHPYYWAPFILIGNGL